LDSKSLQTSTKKIATPQRHQKGSLISQKEIRRTKSREYKKITLSTKIQMKRQNQTTSYSKTKPITNIENKLLQIKGEVIH